jgi:microcystin degradation protein MlrC
LVLPVSDEAFRYYNDMICESFAQRAGTLDGVLLYLHGAMVTESDLDPEKTIVENVRKVLGSRTPIVVAFDLHGNLTPSILKTTDAVVSYRSSPHIDMRSTGERAASLLLGMLDGSSKPVSAMAKPGVVVPSVFSATTTSPGSDIISHVLQWQDTPGVLDVSFLFGFAWSDVPGLGCSAV